MRLLIFFGILFLLPLSALADTMTATRPGLMCTSPTALAALTLPDGSNRASSTFAKPGDIKIATDGGCITIPNQAQVVVQNRRRNTSIVTFVTDKGPETFYVPNIDFGLPASDGAVTAFCLPYDKAVTLVGTITVGKVYGEDNQGRLGWSHWQQITLTKSICTIANEAANEDSKANVQAIQYYSDNHVSDHLNIGEKVTIVGKLDPAETSNYWYLPVYIDIQTVRAN